MSNRPPWIQRIERHAELPSTNDRGLEWAREDGAHLPALVIAERQMAGRGRGKNKWWSGDGALTFSLVLDAANPLGDPFSNAVLAEKSVHDANRGLAEREWPKLSLTTAIAVCDMLDQVAPATPWGIKWPNDVVTADTRQRKIAGILLESPGKVLDLSRRIVVGVGININNSFQIAPAEIRECGIALCDTLGHDSDLEAILDAFLFAFARRLWQQLASDSQLFETWRQRCVLRGRRLTIVQDKPSMGICHGIDADGALLLSVGGSTQRFYSGTVAIS